MSIMEILQVYLAYVSLAGAFGDLLVAEPLFWGVIFVNVIVFPIVIATIPWLAIAWVIGKYRGVA